MEGRRHDTVIHELETAASQLDAGHVRHGIGRTAVHLHVDDQLLDLVAPRRFIQADQSAAQHGHAHTHHLTRTQVTVGRSGFIEQGFKGLHLRFLHLLNP
jgi:hypothetical protein